MQGNAIRITLLLVSILAAMALISCSSGSNTGTAAFDEAAEPYGSEGDSTDDDAADDDDTDDDVADDDVADDDDQADDDDETDDDDDYWDLFYSEVDAAGQVRAMVADVDSKFIFAADNRNNEVIFLDTDSGIIEDRVSVGSSPLDIDINPEGTRLWIATEGASAVSYVETGSKSKGAIPLNHNSIGVAVGGNGKVYVINDDGNVEIVDEATQTLIAEKDWLLEGPVAPI